MRKGVLAGLICIFAAIGGLLWCNRAVYGQQQPGANAGALAEKRKALEENARQALRSKEWKVYTVPESGKGLTETDVITFTEEGKVSSKNLLAKGYGDSNFRLTVQDDESAVWETMKVDKDKNLAFLRGELRANEMAGSIFMKSAKGVTATYYYGTTQPHPPAPEEVPSGKKGKKGK